MERRSNGTTRSHPSGSAFENQSSRSHRCRTSEPCSLRNLGIFVLLADSGFPFNRRPSSYRQGATCGHSLDSRSAEAINSVRTTKRQTLRYANNEKGLTHSSIQVAAQVMHQHSLLAFFSLNPRRCDFGHRNLGDNWLTIGNERPLLVGQSHEQRQLHPTETDRRLKSLKVICGSKTRHRLEIWSLTLWPGLQ